MGKPADAVQCAAAYDEWIASLTEAERKTVENAVRQAANVLPHVGLASAKELVVKTMLYCERKTIK